MRDAAEVMLGREDLPASAARTHVEVTDDFTEAVPIAFAVFDPQCFITHVNTRFADLVRAPKEQCVGKTLDDLVPTFARPVHDLAQRVWHSKCPLRTTIRAPFHAAHPEAAQTWSITLAPTVLRSGQLAAMFCYLSESNEDRGSRERVEFESFLSDLSAAFANSPSQSVDAAIETELKRLVEFLGVDQATLLSIESPTGQPSVYGSYALPGVEARRDEPPFAGDLMSGQVVYLPSIASLPVEAQAHRQYCAARGFQSYLGIPLSVAGRPSCVLEIASTRTTTLLASDLIPRLRLVGEIFVNAISRRNSERELRQMQAELAHVTRTSTVSHLAASIAHEINQPLTAILSNAHAAIRTLTSAKPDLTLARDALRDIVSDDKRAAGIMSRAHTMLRRRPAEFSVDSINDVVQDVVALLRSDALMRRIQIRTKLAHSLPPIRGDCVQLQQVVMNLIVNAMDSIDLTDRGPRDVLITTEYVDKGIQVAVHDTGTGLATHVLAKMFDPFFTTKSQGLGMGLAINSEIVAAHGGRIWAANNPKIGATVGFTLPRAESTSG